MTLGLVPRQSSTGGKTKSGSVSKKGRTEIRRLLIIGAISVIRWVIRKGGSPNRWLAALVARKPKMVAAGALANIPLAAAQRHWFKPGRGRPG